MTLTTRHLALLACLFVPACSAGPESFWRGMTRAVCKYNRTCAADQRSVAECADQSYLDSETPESFGEWCADFDSGSARECLSYIREARDGCGGFAEAPQACEGVCGPGSQIVFYPVEAGLVPIREGGLPLAAAD